MEKVGRGKNLKTTKLVVVVVVVVVVGIKTQWAME